MDKYGKIQWRRIEGFCRRIVAYRKQNAEFHAILYLIHCVNQAYGHVALAVVDVVCLI